jgi:hypothetical protein
MNPDWDRVGQDAFFRMVKAEVVEVGLIFFVAGVVAIVGVAPLLGCGLIAEGVTGIDQASSLLSYVLWTTF